MIRNVIILNALNQEAAAQVSLAVDPTVLSNMNVDGEFRNVAVDVATSSQAWDYSIDVAWISVTGASKLGDDSAVKITAEAQPEGAQPPRTGHVTFTSTGCSNVVVTVNQVARSV